MVGVSSTLTWWVCPPPSHGGCVLHPHSERQTKDDKASVERSRKEMVKLDNQLKVSLQQFSKVRGEHQQLLELVKDEETKIGNAEHSLKVIKRRGSRNFLSRFLSIFSYPFQEYN